MEGGGCVKFEKTTPTCLGGCLGMVNIIVWFFSGFFLFFFKIYPQIETYTQQSIRCWPHSDYRIGSTVDAQTSTPFEMSQPCQLIFQNSPPSASASGPSVCLGIWGLKRNGGGCEGGRMLWGGSVQGGEGPLWGTSTIIKDSTAASAWFACLIICHMLHRTAISHIRAWKLQPMSLRLDQRVCLGRWGGGGVQPPWSLADVMIY